MKAFFQHVSLEQIRQKIASGYDRFPLFFFYIFTLAAIYFFLHHFSLRNTYETILIKISLSLILMIFLSIIITLVSEVQSYDRRKKVALSAYSLPFGALFYWGLSINFFSFEDIVSFLLILVGFLAALFCAREWKNIWKHIPNQKNFYEDYHHFLSIMLRSAALGGILYLLSAIAIQSIMILFDVSMYSLYGDIAIVCFVLFAPIYALLELDEGTKSMRNKEEDSKIARFVMQYVALPFFLFYFAILYAYTTKVLLQFSDWPKGEVSWMVIGFSLFGYLFYISSWKYEYDFPLLKRARKALPYIIFPQTFMLFYALYLRMVQYDLTINRYFVIVFGVYIVVVSLYYIFSSRKYITMLPVLLAFGIITISVGPWGVFSLPESRQEARLIRYLTELNILQTDGTIIPLSLENTNSGAEDQVYDIVEYLCEMHEYRSVQKIFPQQYSEFLEEFKAQKIDWGDPDYGKTGSPSHWEISSAVLSKIQVQRYYESGRSSYISFSQKYDETPKVINVQGYDFMFDFDSYERILSQEQQLEPIFSATFSSLYSALSIYDTTGKVLEDIDLKSYLTDLLAQATQEYNEVSSDTLEYTFSGTTFDGKIMFSSINFFYPQTEDFQNITSSDTSFPQKSFSDTESVSVSGKILIKQK